MYRLFFIINLQSVYELLGGHKSLNNFQVAKHFIKAQMKMFIERSLNLKKYLPQRNKAHWY